MDMNLQTPKDDEGQGGLACCSPWDCRVGHDVAAEQQQPGYYIITSVSFLTLGIFCLLTAYGFPGGSVGKEFSCNAGDLGLNLGSGRSPGEGDDIPTPEFWPGEFHGLYSSWGCKESDMT